MKKRKLAVVLASVMRVCIETISCLKQNHVRFVVRKVVAMNTGGYGNAEFVVNILKFL